MEVTSEQLCDQIIAGMGTLKLQFAAITEQHDLTPIQAMALHALHKCGDTPMGQMADILHCDASNVTGIVDRLAARGFVERIECPGDRRARRIRLTDKATKIIETMRRALPERIGCNNLNSDEQACLFQLLLKMQANQPALHE